MISLLFIVLFVMGLFFMLLTGKNILLKEKNICVLCATISLTWIGLFLLWKLGFYNNVMIIALFMGMSIVGLFYMIEQRVSEEMTLFRLPFLLTLTVIGYSLLETPEDIFMISVILVILWIFFGLLYYYRTQPLFKQKVQKIIECCKRW